MPTYLRHKPTGDVYIASEHLRARGDMEDIPAEEAQAILSANMPSEEKKAETPAVEKKAVKKKAVKKKAAKKAAPKKPAKEDTTAMDDMAAALAGMTPDIESD
jgi:topoisomerase IA-like protein